MSRMQRSVAAHQNSTIPDGTIARNAEPEFSWLFALIVVGISLWLGNGRIVAADPSEPLTSDQAFGLIRQFCFECHGDHDTPKGDLSLASFRDEVAVRESAATWANVRDALESHDMPPLKFPQPTEPERQALIRWIDAALVGGLPGDVLDPGRPVMRRLTRLEYNNTVRDLLQLNKDVFMFPERLPIKKDYFRPAASRMAQEVLVSPYEYGSKMPALLGQGGLLTDTRAEHGFNNRGDVLNLSPMLFEKYMALAAEILNHPNLFRDSPHCRHLLTVPPLITVSHLASLFALWIGLVALGRRLSLTHVMIAAGSALTALLALRMFYRPEWSFDIELAGCGVLAIASAIWGSGRLSFDQTAANGELSHRSLDGSSLRSVASWLVFGAALLVVTIGRGLIVGAAVGLVAGLAVATLSQRPARKLVFWFAAGLLAIGIATTCAHLPAEYDLSEIRSALGRARVQFKARPADFLSGSRNILVIATFCGLFVLLAVAARLTRRLPVLRVAWAGLLCAMLCAVCLLEDIPTRLFVFLDHRVVDASPLREVCRRRVAPFMELAFRRPIDDSTVDRYLALYDLSAEVGGSYDDRIKAVLTAVLCAPEFIYRIEPATDAPEPVRMLDDHELASRLSYFLWSTMPDRGLFDSARQGLLHQDEELDRQVRRMLKDPKVRELSENFAFQWLQMQQIFSARPNPEMFADFYALGEADTKESAATCMLIEPILFFETLFIEDRSVLELVDTEFTYLNPRLARIYGMEHLLPPVGSTADGSDSQSSSSKARKIAADTWHRVKLPDRNRGGVVTMAGPLTITSFPFRTSPVKRGAWVLETVFNRPPDEPKMAVTLKSDSDGSDPDLTVRQKFEKHRSDPACSACHGRIDPPGFALETFDPIGAWRTHDGAQPVDAAAELADGRHFNGPAEFKQAILQHEEEFVRGFVEHLLSFALGRKLEIHDRAAVEQITKAAAEEQYRFSRILIEIVRSRPFRFISNRPAEGGKE